DAAGRVVVAGDGAQGAGAVVGGELERGAAGGAAGARDGQGHGGGLGGGQRGGLELERAGVGRGIVVLDGHHRGRGAAERGASAGIAQRQVERLVALEDRVVEDRDAHGQAGLAGSKSQRL